MCRAQHSQALMRPRGWEAGTPVLCPDQGTQTGSEKGKGQYHAWLSSSQVSLSFNQAFPPSSSRCVKGTRGGDRHL